MQWVTGVGSDGGRYPVLLGIGNSVSRVIHKNERGKRNKAENAGKRNKAGNAGKFADVEIRSMSVSPKPSLCFWRRGCKEFRAAYRGVGQK